MVSNEYYDNDVGGHVGGWVVSCQRSAICNVQTNSNAGVSFTCNDECCSGVRPVHVASSAETRVVTDQLELHSC